MAEIKTQWKRFSVTRLRECIECGLLFPSAGAEERRCTKCAKSLDDSRARAFAPSEERDLRDFLDYWFDWDAIPRQKRNAEHDNAARHERRKRLTW